MNSDSENELLNELRKGSEAAFDELFRRYWKKSLVFAYAKVKSKEQAEEIVQDIFTAIWDKRTSLSIENFSQYIHSAIKYQALNKIRSKVVQEKYWNYYKAFIPETEETTENTVAYDNLVEVIDHKLTELSPKMKRVFFLSRLNGLATKEIASVLGLSEKAIEYHITRSIKELKVYLKEISI